MSEVIPKVNVGGGAIIGGDLITGSNRIRGDESTIIITGDGNIVVPATSLRGKLRTMMERLDKVEEEELLTRSTSDLAAAYDATIQGWSLALDLRDREVEGHTQRVVQMTLKLALAMGMTDEQLIHVRRGALLHDIGKMGIPDSILHKSSALTAEEWEIVKRHPQYAHDLLAPIVYLRPALDIPYAHHERWDGTGYPRGLKGEEIPLAARVFAVADAYDALRSERPYRSGWSDDKAREYIRQQAGEIFDPDVVAAFMAVIDEET